MVGVGHPVMAHRWAKLFPVVRRIFDDYLDGNGDRAIAPGLNRDGVPCPSRRHQDQNKHRLADGWQGSTVRAILENPRYTGYAVFGRWTKHEMLADPDDVAAGHVTRFRRSSPDRIVRSRKPAHPAIVSVEDFTQVQLLRKSRSVGSMRGITKLERKQTTTKHTYLLRGHVRCEICTRKMQGGMVRSSVYCRCLARTLAPGAAALASHPKTVNLREDVLVPAINEWIGRVFAPENRDATVAALVGSQGGVQRSSGQGGCGSSSGGCGSPVEALSAAIAAGVDPSALVEVINQAQAECETARAEIGNFPTSGSLDQAEVYAMIDALGDVGAVLKDARPQRLMDLYRDLRLKVSYRNDREAVVTTASLRVSNECVRGPS
ncbi:recombinase family protein [Actinokineospora guangxiensis]|uniref:Recombinase family protein n=1 Tax=Actinokineospora guangxiensis TaxID=1490288 RepID=A0ABW0EQ93_9PSEU